MILALISCKWARVLRGHWLMLRWCRCFGGYPSSAWKFWTKKGLVTGGLYGSKVGKSKLKQSGIADKVKSELNPYLTGCRPYSIPPCEHHANGKLPPCNGSQETPKSQKRCKDGYPKSYLKDKHIGTCFSLIFSAVSHLVSVGYAPWFHLLQVNARTAPPSRSRSWLSCTTAVPWRQPSVYMQIFHTTRQVRMLKRLFLEPELNSCFDASCCCRCVPARDREDARGSHCQDVWMGRGEWNPILAGCKLLEWWLGR